MLSTPMIICLATCATDLPEMPRYSELARLELDPAVLATAGQDAPADSEPIPAADAPKPYGSMDSWRWYAQGGFALEFDDINNKEFLVGAGVSYFILEGLSLEFELNLIWVNQVGEDAFAVNFVMLARWHFLMEDTWSLYGDFGAGIMGSTAKVPGPDADEPRGGSHFNFTPQLGGGVSIEIAPDIRLLIGARWQHISNAQTHESNPPRDSLLVYAGVSVPF